MDFFATSRAHFCEVLVFAELPEKLQLKYGWDVMAKLKKCWYSLEDASRIWQGDNTPLIAEYGNCRGKKTRSDLS